MSSLPVAQAAKVDWVELAAVAKEVLAVGTAGYAVVAAAVGRGMGCADTFVRRANPLHCAHRPLSAPHSRTSRADMAPARR